MGAELGNVYESAAYADAYARLELPATYQIAFRDLPALLARHVRGRRTLDFGCGAGRSTRFLKRLGFDALGVDVSAPLIRIARTLDAGGDYRLLDADDFAAAGVSAAAFDLVFSGFAFDNIPQNRKAGLLAALRGLLVAGGRVVNLVSTPEIYTHEWASFTTQAFPENGAAKDGDVVRIVNISIEDRRPIEDVLCGDEAYRDLYARAGLRVLDVARPLAAPDEPGGPWVSETAIPPWAIYVLEKV